MKWANQNPEASAADTENPDPARPALSLDSHLPLPKAVELASFRGGLGEGGRAGLTLERRSQRTV